MVCHFKKKTKYTHLTPVWQQYSYLRTDRKVRSVQHGGPPGGGERPLSFLFGLDLRCRMLIILVSITSQIVHNMIHHWSGQGPSSLLFFFLFYSYSCFHSPPSTVSHSNMLNAYTFWGMYFGFCFIEVKLTDNSVLISGISHSNFIFVYIAK